MFAIKKWSSKNTSLLGNAEESINVAYFLFTYCNSEISWYRILELCWNTRTDICINDAPVLNKGIFNTAFLILDRNTSSLEYFQNYKLNTDSNSTWCYCTRTWENQSDFNVRRILHFTYVYWFITSQWFVIYVCLYTSQKVKNTQNLR